MLSQIKRAIDEDTMLTSTLYTFMDRPVHISVHDYTYVHMYTHIAQKEKKKDHVHIYTYEVGEKLPSLC